MWKKWKLACLVLMVTVLTLTSFPLPGNVALQGAAAAESKLSGTQFGTSPAWNNGTSTYDKAFDGNTSTFFDYSQGDGGYTGIDLGSGAAKKITRIRYHARAGYESRMVGGKFQGSNTSSSSGYTDLHTIAAAPSGWAEVTISNTNTYRYIRYLSPNGGYTNIAELEFYGDNGTGMGSGTIEREYWTGITGTAVSAIPLSSTPSGKETLTKLEGPLNWGDNYGTRIRGFIHPPATGSYTFYISGDDESELWLSNSDNPSGKTKIAYVAGWTDSRIWNKYPSQQSSSISLTAGQKYYVEVLHKEGGGGDNVAVGWTGPGISAITVIAGNQLSPYDGTNPPPDPQPSGSNMLGINVLHISDYSEDKPFADVMKSSRQWQTLSGGTPTKDINGWPTQDAKVMIWGDAHDMHGTYKLSFKGNANLAFRFVSGSIANKVYNAATNTTTADVIITQAGKSTIEMDFTGTNGGVKDVKMMRPISPGSSTSYSSDVTFTTQYKNAISKFSTIRFMDFTATNSNQQVNWSDRVLPTDATQQQSAPGYGWQGKGAAWEYAIQLANDTNKDAWICVPAKASDDYITKLAQLWKNGGNGFAGLKPGLKLYVEYSNELWNTAGAFQQSNQNREMAMAEVQAGGSPLNYDGLVDSGGWTLAWRRIGKRTVDISNTFRSVFGDADMMTRIRPVLMWQQGNGQGTASAALPFIEGYYGQVRPGNPVARPVKELIYAGGGSAYYNPDNHSDSLTIDNIWNSDTFDINAWKQPLKTDVDWTAAYGIKRIAYEGGPSLDPTGHSEAVKAQSVNDNRMTAEIVEHHDLWSNYGGDLLMYFNIAGDYSWGFTPNINNLDTPKYRAIDNLNSASKAALTYSPAAPVTLDGNAFSVSSRGWGTPGTGSVRIDNGIWYGYTFRKTASSSTIFTFDYTASGSGEMELFVDGISVKTMSFASTGGSTQKTAAYTITLDAGLHSVRLKAKTGSFDLQKVNIGQ